MDAPVGIYEKWDFDRLGSRGRWKFIFVELIPMRFFKYARSARKNFSRGRDKKYCAPRRTIFSFAEIYFFPPFAVRARPLVRRAGRAAMMAILHAVLVPMRLYVIARIVLVELVARLLEVARVAPVVAHGIFIFAANPGREGRPVIGAAPVAGAAD